MTGADGRGRPAGPARQERLRELNLELVLGHVLAAEAPVSRTELAAATGLTRPTITRIVDELIAARLVAESGSARDGRAGRPRVGLAPSRIGPAGLGLDIRADGLAACVVDLTGGVRHLAFAPFAFDGAAPSAVLGRLAGMAAEAVAAVAAERLTVTAVTLAVPGAVDGGTVRSAPALGWADVDAGALLREGIGDLGLPVAVDNEANLAARGERHAAGRALDNFVYVSGGLDIGAGIVLDGRLLRGSRGRSGGLGHVTVDPGGRRCPCGSRGCLRAYAGPQAILGGADLTPGAMPEAAATARADAGDPDTLAALEAAGTALGVALSNVLNLIDVDTVLLGGGFALLASWVAGPVAAEVERRVRSAAWAPVAVRPAVLGPDAAAIGAALSFVDRLRADPGAWLAARR